ncbi:MAG: 5'-deoxynucleotidase [Oscillospiraceae bacterium]
MPSGFSAMLARMNYINRWGLMRNTRSETLSEHSLATATTAHMLACAATDLFDAEDVSPERVACCAIYHDAAEIMTGDLPTPVKYSNERIRSEYKKLESDAEIRLCSMAPDELRGTIRPYVTGEMLSLHEQQIIKAADKICALVKCLEEEGNGNTEFASAKSAILAWLSNSQLPETQYFIEELLPCFSFTLDELLSL